MESVSPTLGAVLRSGRAEFNRRFAAARRTYPELDPSAFTEFLRGPVDQLVQAVEQVRSDRVAEVVLVAYDAAMEIVGLRLAGPKARQDFVQRGWSRVLPKAARLVAEAPSRMCSAVTNALVNLSATPGAQPERWLETMEQLASRCDNAEAFLKLGQVMAWRSGLAHFRSGALAQADALPEELVLAALGADGSIRWPEMRRRLQENHWFDPSAPSGNAGPRPVSRCGTFRGFGGLFAEPPLIAPSGEHFLVRSGDDCWLLAADVFGSTFHRASMGEFETARKRPPLPPGFQLNPNGLSLKGTPLDLAGFGPITSAAANAFTFAATSTVTHSILLVALH